MGTELGPSSDAPPCSCPPSEILVFTYLILQGLAFAKEVPGQAQEIVFRVAVRDRKERHKAT